MKKIVFSTFITILALGIGSVLFYWYQIRPAQIKHDCSWVGKHADAQPGRPAVTKDQLITKGIIRSCQKEIEALKDVSPIADYKLGDMSVYAISSPPSQTSNGYLFNSLFDDPLWEATSCIEDGNKVITAYAKPVPAVPAKDWYEAATKEEYNFCLHDKGL